ncbi:diguanylate cyclase [Xanthobacter sp. VNH20]|uniref:sensor domain-containing diguanylate cyclase n=1 Tax=Xanthobacter sp. VNH20 TaxID=3156616 RepID=UPI0032B3E15F
MADQAQGLWGRHRRRNVSIRRRLAYLILLVALPISAERIYALLASRDEQIDRTYERLRDIADSAALAQREAIGAAQAVVQTLSRQASSLMEDPPACEQFLRRLNNEAVGIQGALIAGVDGRIVCASTRALMGVDLSDRDYVRAALATPQPAISNLITARNTGRSVIAVAEAERDAQGDPIALAIVGVDLQWMSRIASQSGVQDGVTVCVIDGGGTMLVRYPIGSNLAGNSFRSHPLVQRVLSGNQGQMKAKGIDGEERYYAFSRLAGTDLRVLVGSDSSMVIADIDQRIFTIFFALLAGVALLIVLAWYAADKLVVEPVQQLALDIVAVGREEADTISQVRVEEFQPLVAAFGEMNQRLSERTEELRSQNGRLAALARMDGLTGLANRRTFDVQLSEDWVRAGDLRRPLALVMADVDHFKLFNDARGHLAGDDALRSVARMLSAATAGTRYLAARYGGEEFVVLLPDTDLAGAVEFAEDVRRLVAALGIEHPGVPSRRLTASFGAAATVPRFPGSPDGLLAAVDAALYEAKRQGRNRVIAAPDLAVERL